MGLFSFKNIKKSSVYITPNFPVLETRRYKFSLTRVISVIFLYTLVVTLLVLAILLFTPVRNIVFFFENEKLTEQVDRVKELEGKIVFLSTQLEKVASTNEKLKYAMILASTDSIDSTAAIYDSLRQQDPEGDKTGGSLITVARDLFSKIFDDQEEMIFVKPVDGVIVKKFQPERGHMGVDYGVKKGTPVIAVQSGTVTFSGFTAEYGYTLILTHEKDFTSLYKHCEILLFNDRDFVQAGETIALSGNSGEKSTGPHLHFELWKKGKPVDPQKFIINR